MLGLESSSNIKLLQFKIETPIEKDYLYVKTVIIFIIF